MSCSQLDVSVSSVFVSRCSVSGCRWHQVYAEVYGWQYPKQELASECFVDLCWVGLDVQYVHWFLHVSTRLSPSCLSLTLLFSWCLNGLSPLLVCLLNVCISLLVALQFPWPAACWPSDWFLLHLMSCDVAIVSLLVILKIRERNMYCILSCILSCFMLFPFLVADVWRCVWPFFLPLAS